jgi:hypothetical protein
MMMAKRPSERRFVQEPHEVASQKRAFFIVSVVKTSNFLIGLSSLARCTVATEKLPQNHGVLQLMFPDG